MAWSAKLQSGEGGVQGYNEWELVFDAATQTAYKLTYQVSLGDEAPEVLYHKPDNGAAIPVRANGRNRVVFLEMHIPEQTSWDDVLNKITPISRLVNGSDSQATKASIDGSAETVRVAIKPDGATETTYFDVLEGFVDTSTALTGAVSVLNKMAHKVIVSLTCKPYGYGDSFPLNDDLPSSPHFIEGNTSGFGDGWQSFATAPTASLTTTRYLIGGQCQRISVTSAASTQGIRANDVTASMGTDAVFSVYIYANAPADDDIITIDLVDGSNNAVTGGTQSVEYNPADATDYDKTGIDPETGRTWFRYVVSGNNSVAADFRFRIYRNVTDASNGGVYFIDAAYAQLDTLTAQNGWASSGSLNNRYDPTTTSAATRQQINYLDVWGIPGDAPSLLNLTLSQTASDVDGFIAATLTDGGENLKANKWKHVLDSARLAVTTGTVSTVADASRVSGSYLRWTTSGTAKTNYPTGIDYATDSLVWAGFDYWLSSIPAQVYAVARTSNASNTMTLSWSGEVSGSGAAASFDTVSTWELLDLGLMNVTNRRGRALIIPQVSVTVAGGNIELDCLIFMPLQPKNFMIVPFSQGTAISPIFKTSGSKKYVTHQKPVGLVLFQDIVVERLGELWTIPSGNRMTRLFFLMVGNYSTNPQEFNINTATTITTTIAPRTAHLLGT